MLTGIEERCAGIDVGKRELAVTVMTGPAHEDPVVETRLFGTTNRSLQQMRQWLLDSGCKCVVMESTGSYWKPVFYALEKDLRVDLANPMHGKPVAQLVAPPREGRVVKFGTMRGKIHLKPAGMSRLIWIASLRVRSEPLSARYRRRSYGDERA